jgi:hypothetical protein
MKTVRIFLILFVVTLSTFVNAQGRSDADIFKSFMDYASKSKLNQLNNSDRIIKIALYFIDCPYVAGTLEADGPETLQVNLRGFDCMTFVENVLAFDNLLQSKNRDFESFKNELKKIRYRDGVLDNYTSRLHYTTDWIFNNQKKGVVRLVDIGTKYPFFPVKVGYMSSHPEAYPPLKSNPDFVSVISEQEARINKLSFRYIPKGFSSTWKGFIKNGDIIAITTNITGLDFSHLGFAVKDNKGAVRFIHASSSMNKIVFSSETLDKYLSGVSRHTGFVIVRPI